MCKISLKIYEPFSFDLEIEHLNKQISKCKDENLKKELIRRRDLYPKINLHIDN